jgi:soluble lytic murein transglycosylase-like protein
MSEAALLAIIAAVEASQGIPAGLLQAVCKIESGLRPQAVNHKDGNDEQSSIGLCQVKLTTGKQYSKAVRSAQSLYDPSINAAAAGAYLKANFVRYRSWVGAVITFNKGHWSGGCTNRYFRKVEAERRKYVGTKATLRCR